MTKTEKTTIRKYVERHYSDRDPQNIRIHADGHVTCNMISELGRSHGRVQVFCGWDADLLYDARVQAAYDAEILMPAIGDLAGRALEVNH